MLNIIDILEKQLPKCSPAEKAVAHYILNHPSQVKDMSTKVLADSSKSSPAAVIRLCKRIGIDSFRKLKMELRQLEIRELQEQFIERDEQTLDQTSEMNALTLDFFDQYKRALENTKLQIQPRKLKEAVDYILKGNKICLFGASESSLVAMDAYYKLLRINENVFFSQDSHISMMYVTNMRKDDVLFLVTVSGKTKEALELIEIAQKRNIKIITLTQSKKSPAARNSSVVLYTPKEEGNLRIGTMITRITQLAMIDLLFMQIYNARGQDVVNYLIETHNTVQAAKR